MSTATHWLHGPLFLECGQAISIDIARPVAGGKCNGRDVNANLVGGCIVHNSVESYRIAVQSVTTTLTGRLTDEFLPAGFPRNGAEFFTDWPTDRELTHFPVDSSRSVRQPAPYLDFVGRAPAPTRQSGPEQKGSHSRALSQGLRRWPCDSPWLPFGLAKRFKNLGRRQRGAAPSKASAGEGASGRGCECPRSGVSWF